MVTTFKSVLERNFNRQGEQQWQSEGFRVVTLNYGITENWIEFDRIYA